MNAVIDFKTASKESLMQTCRITKDAAENAVWKHYEAAMTYYRSGAWKTDYKSWQACCKANPDALYSDSYYRTLGSALPIAQAVELVSGETLLPTQARTLQAKLNEIIPEDERAPQFVLGVLGLAYAYDENTTIPARNVLDEAYQILSKERDSGAIDYEGKTYNFKDMVQVAQLRDRVSQDIEARSKWEKIAIEDSRQKQLMLRLARRMGHKVPKDTRKLLLSWEDES